jgi:hypothetical protein
MKQFVALAFLFAFCPLAALAQNETVEVNGQESLTGVWKITFPGGASGYMPGRGRLYTATIQSFCRLQQVGEKVSAACLPGWGPDSGSGELDGKALHLAWGIALARSVIDATVEQSSAHAFQGEFALKILGIRHAAPTPATAHRLMLGPAAPDTAGKAKLLTRTLEELAAGAIATPHETDVALVFGHQMGANQANTAEEIRGLGKVEAVLYLGEGSAPHSRVSDVDTTKVTFTLPGFAFSAYQVEFTHGERLCGIHQREDGTLDGFLCV